MTQQMSTAGCKINKNCHLNHGKALNKYDMINLTNDGRIVNAF